MEFEYQGDSEETKAEREQANRDRANSAINNLNGGSYESVVPERVEASEPQAHTKTCAVCFSDFKKDDLVAQLSCRHVFHRACI